MTTPTVALVRGELLRLRTVRAPWLLLLAAQFIVVTGVSGLVLGGADLDSRADQSKAVAHVGLAALFTLVFGLLAVAGEYRHRTITDTYLSTPQRGRVIASKLGVYGVIGLASGLVGAAVALASAAAWWAGKGSSFDFSSTLMWRTLLGGVLWNAAFAVVGVGLGALVRNLVGAIAAALAWIALVEGIVGQLVGDTLSRWLPFKAGQALGLADADGSDLLPQWGGGVLLLAYTAVFAMIAVSTTLRRDVT
ncbi:MAG: ABC transporter permease subunit [Streptomycetaceae bacterium]|nr:ABC transporter permease subunit [Streptomycetaceae bacterium]